MHPFKSLIFDGVSPTFYKNFWEIVGKDVIRACLEILNGDMFAANFNHARLVLIPKCKYPKRMRDFFLISLCNMTYKIISCIRLSPK